MRALVTGGAGFIGSHIAEALVNDLGAEVIVYDNLSVGSRNNVPAGCTLVVGDIRDKSALTEAMKGIDVVFHNAAFVSIRGSFERIRDDIETNCLGTVNVLEVAREMRVQKVVFASSMAVYGKPHRIPVVESDILQPVSPYGLSKTRGEMYCKWLSNAFAVNIVVLRYFNTYGARQTPSAYVGVLTTFINQALDGSPLTVFGDGSQTRDFVWVKDVARANVLAATKDVTGIFNVASGTETSINQLADMVIRHLGGRKEYLKSPPGEIDRIRADVSRSQEVLGFRAQGSIQKVLPSVIEWQVDARKRGIPR